VGTPPTPNPSQTLNVQQGRLSNLQNAWLLLQGVTYPLVDESRNVFFASYKFDPQEGLPRFCIITNDLDYTTMRLYPSPSQIYSIYVYGKFQLAQLTTTSTMAYVPQYYYQYFSFAVAKQLAFYKGRGQAWTPDLQAELERLSMEVDSISPINLTITSEHDSLLNGSWRVRAGI
jgi:hypothetical protein